MSTTTTTSPQARLVFQDAFDRLKDSVTANDARDFQSTTLQDVRNAALELENQLGGRKSLQNMRRLVPFLAGIEKYAHTVDILCNGTPFLPWIWAPVKLMLQLAVELPSAFEKLITAYKRIAENLPRFDRLAATFVHKPDFQQVLAVFYADILEFHRRAYKFFRRRGMEQPLQAERYHANKVLGWTFFFKSSWAQFDGRFNHIIADLARHSDLVDKEASALSIEQTNEWRKRWLEEVTAKENKTSASHLKAAISWLEGASLNQEDNLDSWAENCHPGSCDWIHKHAKMKAWTRQGADNPILWLNGKPGSGKTVICSQIVNSLIKGPSATTATTTAPAVVATAASVDTATATPTAPAIAGRPTVLYHFFDFDSSNNKDVNNCSILLQSLTAQAIRSNHDLAALVYDDVLSHGSPSIAQMRRIVPTLLATFHSVRIVVDGLDECNDKDQGSILKELIALGKNIRDLPGGTSANCKILVSSRDVDQISRHLSRRATIALGTESTALSSAIQGYVSSRVTVLVSNLDGVSSPADVSFGLEEALVGKADGMFLWVYLVISVLQDLYSIADMMQAIETLPKDLDAMYNRIMERLEDRLNLQTQSHKTAIRTLNWIACAERPLKKHELQHGICLYPDNNNNVVTDGTKPSRRVFDLCKPLLEDGPNDTVRFVHSSVKQFLLKPENPYLPPSMAHFDIAFSCVAYLCSALSLLDPSSSEVEHIGSVVKGYHGLMSYATEKWSEHLLAFLDKSGKKIEESSPLYKQVSALCQKHNALKGNGKDRTQMEEDRELTVVKDHRLQYLKDQKDISSLVSRHLGFNRALKDAQKDVGLDPDEPQLQKDSTLFSELQRKYQQIARQSLALDSWNGVSDASLADFKKIFADSAFLCGFRSCPRAVHGFLNADELKEHETTHIVNLLCSDDNCEYSKIGFKTARTLKRHILDFHTASTARIIPPSIHRIDTSLSGGTLVSERYAGKDSDEEPPSPEPLPIDPGFPVNRNPLLGKPWEPAVEDLVDELSGDVV